MEDYRIQVDGITDVGRVRKSNQDFILFDQKSKFYIVADGMGGHAGGEIASKMCVESIYQSLHNKMLPKLGKITDEELCLQLARFINEASEKIFDKSLEVPNLRGMGTTATMVFIHDQRAYMGHVGDSRLYLIRGGYVYQISQDHSLVSEQLRAGMITEEEAEGHHLRNVITRSVGYQEEEEVDTDTVQLLPGDYLVLCSDGLHGKIHSREISILVSEQGVAATTTLIELAKERGGEDNISVIIIKIQEKL